MDSSRFGIFVLVFRSTIGKFLRLIIIFKLYITVLGESVLKINLVKIGIY